MSVIIFYYHFIDCREGDVKLENNEPKVYKGGIWDSPCPGCSQLTCLGIKMFCKRLGYELGEIYIKDEIEDGTEKNDTSSVVKSVTDNNETDASIYGNCLERDAWILCTGKMGKNETTQSCTNVLIQKIKCMNSTSFIENRKSSC